MIEAVIVNQRGLHARAASKLAALAREFNANIMVGKDGQMVGALSIMGLLMLGAVQGSQISITASGPDAAAALAAIAALIARGFDESD